MFVKKFVAKIIDCRIVYSFAVKYIPSTISIAVWDFKNINDFYGTDKLRNQSVNRSWQLKVLSAACCLPG